MLSYAPVEKRKAFTPRFLAPFGGFFLFSAQNYAFFFYKTHDFTLIFAKSLARRARVC
jgi:hypothetical protein